MSRLLTPTNPHDYDSFFTVRMRHIEESMTIITAVDQSDWALSVVDEAQTLAAQFGEELHVLHVLTESEAIDLDRRNVRETGKSKGRDGLAHIAADVASSAIDTTSDECHAVGRIGNPPEEIIAYAVDHNARYIVVGGRKRSPVGKVVFGSVTQSVLLNAPCPVLTVGKEITT